MCVASAARNLSAEVSVEERVIRLKDQVGFIRSDVSDIKADVRRLDIKVDGTRDSLLNVIQSVASVRESVAVLSAKVDERSSFVAARIDVTAKVLDDRFSALSATSDAANKEPTARIDDGFRALTTSWSATIEALIECIDTQFERQFFRMTAVLIGAAPVIYGSIVFLQKASLGASQIGGIAIASGVLIWIASFYVTRRTTRKR
jgi:ribosome-associated toxin RatA of RatAB toxin-antitoxin module